MKIYLCTSCNKTIPLKDLATHRRQCGPNAEIILKTGTESKVGKVFADIFKILASILLFGLGIWLGSSSFKSIASMRQLERIPATVIQGVLPGEVNLNGTAQKLDQVLQAPKSGVSCLHYRYKVEIEEKDSDGDKSWRTVSDDTVSADFVLKDNTGEIAVRTAGTINFNLPRSFRTRQGHYRYTEWRIDPNDKLFLFGYIVHAKNGYEVRFDQSGCYEPIISKHDEQHERLNMAYASIGKCWGGLVALAFAASLMFAVLRIHRLLVYFSILSTIIVVDLFVLGCQMIKNDLRSANNRLDKHEQTAIEAISKDLRQYNIAWNGNWDSLDSFDNYETLGLKKKNAERLARIRLDFALATKRAQLQRNAFPERLLASVWKIPRKASIHLPESEKTQLAQLTAKFRKAQVPPLIGWGFIGGSLLVALTTLGFGFKEVRFKRCIENLPTSATAGAAYGLSEFKGFVKLPDTEEPLNGPLSLTPCVQYHYVVKEKRSSGKNSHWATILDNTQERPFLCEDDEGSIWIDPDGAEIMTVHRTTRHEGQRRYSETRLELNDPLYAIGECVIEPGFGDRLYLKKPQDSYPFILSNLTESVVMRQIAAIGILLLNISFATILLAALTLFGLSGAFAATDYLTSALAAPTFMIFITLVLHINDLVFLRNRANRNWANIDISLQKRHDLIPTLQQTVQSYMTHEIGLQQAIAQMRSAYGNGRATDPETVGKFIQNERSALSQLLGVFENYPNLKTDTQTALFMRTIILLENEICLMKTGYNDAVETYNTRIQKLPDLIFAKMFGFREMQFIHADSDVVRIPPSLQNIWQKDNVEKARKATTQQVDSTTEHVVSTAQPPYSAMATIVASTAVTDKVADEDTDTDVVDARAVIFALLLGKDEAVRQKQLNTIAEKDSAIVSRKTRSLIAAVTGDVKDDVGRLRTAEEWFPKLESLSPGGYNRFRQLVRELMEADDEISLFEYALQKSITYRLDKAFGLTAKHPVRHTNLSLVIKQTLLALSRLVYSEEKTGETGQIAFDLGVAQLNYAPKSDLKLIPREQCTLAAFDEAIEELAHAANSVKANILFACGEAVKMNNDYTYDQALLLMAMADTFNLNRPDWC
ncbi:MAG: LemA family protein [Lentisphaerae bacterium]|nr:LemA family protein [Lentisphaerota bacterium]